MSFRLVQVSIEIAKQFYQNKRRPSQERLKDIIPIAVNVLQNPKMIKSKMFFDQHCKD